MVERFRVGRWRLEHRPEGWEDVPELGMRDARTGCFPSCVVATQDELGPDELLEAYIDRQVAAMKQFFPGIARMDLPPGAIPGASEVRELELRFAHPGGTRVVQVQVYAASAPVVGVLTFTTEAAEYARTRRDFAEVKRFASFHRQQREG